MVDCRVAPRSSFLAKSNATNSERKRIIWRWHKGEETAAMAFGDPLVATSYSLCVYDTLAGVGSLSVALDVPAGGNWKAAGSERFRYKDKQMRVTLKAGAVRKSRVLFKAKGSSLSMPSAVSSTSMFNQSPLVSVQLVNGEGACWGTGYEPPAVRNRPNWFVTKTTGRHNGACVRSGDQNDIVRVLTEPGAAGFQIDLSRSSGTFQSEYQSADLGMLLAAYPEPFVFSESCLADFIGEKVLQEIKDGDRGAIAPALEQAPGGIFLEQCVEEITMPPMASDTFVTITARSCAPTCFILELYNTGTESIDLTGVVFLMEDFLVDCAGLPDAIPGDGTVTCQIDDIVSTGGSLLEVYGIMALPRVMVLGYPFEE